MSPTRGSNISKDDCHYGGRFASGCTDFQVNMIGHSYKDPPPHPGRAFHSEWIPREFNVDRIDQSYKNLPPYHGRAFNSKQIPREFNVDVIDHSYKNLSHSPGQAFHSEQIPMEFHVDIIGHSYKNLPHPERAFHSEQIPRKQAGFLDRLSQASWNCLMQFEREFPNTSQQTSPFIEQRRSPDDMGSRNTEKITYVAEQVLGKGKLDGETSQYIETTNQLESHSALPHHIRRDAPKPTTRTDVESHPIVPCYTTSSVDVSHSEPIIPSAQHRDVGGGPERTFTGILPDSFANDNYKAQSFGLFIDPIHSLDMPNCEPQQLSFFRNLAQNEFPQKDEIQYPAKIEDVAYPFDHLEHDPTNAKNLSPRNDIHLEVPLIASCTNVDSGISPPGFISSQIDNLTTTEVAEGFDNPFSNMHETTPYHPYFEIIKNKDLEELTELGSGTFGTVYHGKWRGSDVAIKRIKKSSFTGQSIDPERQEHEFLREAEILSMLHHPNVVAFYGVVKDGPGGTLATVTEFMVNGSLRHVLQRKDKYLDRRMRLIIAMGAAFGMEYLHSKNIVHFDLKSDNLLINLERKFHPICKVGDFGLSKIKRNTLVSGGVRGTLPWMAPELLNGSSDKVSEKVDVFSFGIVMWEILTGEEPYANMHYGAIIGGIVNDTLRPPVPASCNPEWRMLMEQCWASDPAQRPAFIEIAGQLRAMLAAANQAKATK
ncbi:unnamed protein product [Urochloa humidicola]